MGKLLLNNFRLQALGDKPSVRCAPASPLQLFPFTTCKKIYPGNILFGTFFNDNKQKGSITKQ